MTAPPPPPETRESWPFEKPPRLQAGRPQFRRGGAVYVWLLRNHERLTKARTEPGFAWRTVAYEIGKAVCNPGKFQPPTPAMVAETWTRVCRDVKRFGYHVEKFEGVVFPGETASDQDFPPLPPPPPVPFSSFAEIAAFVRKAPNGRRSELARWMARHRAEFAAVLAEDENTPNWSAWAERLKAVGVTARGGKPPTADAVRMTWARIEQQPKARKSAKAHASVRMIEPAAAPEPPPSAPAQPPTGNAAEKIRAFREGLRAGKVRIPEPINPAKRKPDGET